MPKMLSFKGDPKPKKRKRVHVINTDDSATRDAPSEISNGHTEEDSDTVWTTADQILDLSGPILLVMAPPSDPPAVRSDPVDVDADEPAADRVGTTEGERGEGPCRTVCVATDAEGKVFASGIENMVEGAPGSAEPHDVRQVWIARRIDGERVCFKGFHGRYLSADRNGSASAKREAVAAEETFTLVVCPHPNGASSSTPRFRLKTCWDTFLARRTEGTDRVVIRTDLTATTEIPEPESQAGADPGRMSVPTDSELILRIQQKHKTRPSNSSHSDSKSGQGEQVSRAQIRADLGKRGHGLGDEDIRLLKRAAREGRYHEALLDFRSKGAHDKFA